MQASFTITTEPIIPLKTENPAAGAVVTFEGLVRNHNNSREVQGLFYDSYRELAEKEGLRILEETLTLFPIHSISAIHRIGELMIGESAIWLQVQSSHRHAAFSAAEYAMDEIKKSVPIWKKEDYVDQKADWLPGETSHPNQEMFLRQALLPEIGEEGQERLAKSKVMVVGAGGLGTPAIEYLVRAGIGQITVIEPDTVEASNLNRQTAYSLSDVGQSKAAILKLRYQSFGSTQIHVCPLRIQETDVEDLVEAHDVVLDCTDDLEAKYLLNDVCVAKSTPLVSASIHRWQGQVFVVDGSPCLRCMLPTPPPQACVGTCQEEGILGTTAGFFGVLQANEAIKIALGMGGTLSNKFLAVDLRDYAVVPIARGVSSLCPNCSGGMSHEIEENVEIEASDLFALNHVVILDCRGDRQEDIANSIAGIPVVETWEEAIQLNPNSVILVCDRGRSSLRRTFQLRDQGHTNVYSLKGGYGALSKQI